MTKADQLLRKIGKACTMIGRDSAGRVVMQVVLDDSDAARSMACAADPAESNIEGDDSRYPEPRVSVCWLESA